MAGGAPGLRRETSVRVPAAMARGNSAAGSALEYDLHSLGRAEAATRAAGLHTALLRHAGDRYRPSADLG